MKSNKHTYSVGDVILIQGYDMPIEITELLSETEYIGYDLNKPKTSNNKWSFPQSDIICLYKPNDPINPNHYKTNSGIECIDIAEWFPYTIGNAIKYLWRNGKKDDVLQELKKAEWYIQRTIDKGHTKCFINSPEDIKIARKNFQQLNEDDFTDKRFYYFIESLLYNRIEESQIRLKELIKHWS